MHITDSINVITTSRVCLNCQFSSSFNLYIQRVSETLDGSPKKCEEWAFVFTCFNDSRWWSKNVVTNNRVFDKCFWSCFTKWVFSRCSDFFGISRNILETYESLKLLGNPKLLFTFYCNYSTSFRNLFQIIGLFTPRVLFVHFIY